MNSNISNSSIDKAPSAHRPRSPWKLRFFLDAEFSSFVETDRQLISIAIVAEDGREFYGEVNDFDAGRLSDFVRQTVVPQLGLFPGRAMTRAQLRAELFAWISSVPAKPRRPILSFDYEGDRVLLLELLCGPLPPFWRQENIRNRVDPARRAAYFQRNGGEHHALLDARANSEAFI
ncbi:3'-5' exoribonuclease [Pandoraea bronchicola]|uniref:3'-5' exoribonuclease.1 n=1 Tax=Pandoraea bronchicola TaxID=2508287 RepID=A0A5E5BP82_9BURK|nr:3'-5' exoribonuclease [Pandoraea bronchicola]VVE87669.1 3'-5' exoribonuclease.1 [Pandoraea bronchicola]